MFDLLLRHVLPISFIKMQFLVWYLSFHRCVFFGHDWNREKLCARLAIASLINLRNIIFLLFQGIPERVHNFGLTSATYFNSYSGIWRLGQHSYQHRIRHTSFKKQLRYLTQFWFILLISSFFSCQFTQDWTHPCLSFHILKLLFSAATIPHPQCISVWKGNIFSLWHGNCSHNYFYWLTE